MRLLLDTHVLLWWLAEDAKLSESHRELILNAENQVWVSSVSIAEISIKASLGKLNAPRGALEIVTKSGFETLAFDPTHAEVLRELPWRHRDPFDRMLVAQARVEEMTLLTVDPRIHEYEVETR